MRVLTTAGVAGAAVGAAWWVRRRGRAQGGTDRPLALTVHRPYDEVVEELARPDAAALLAVGDDAQLELTPAPGSFGTEVRLRPGTHGHASRAEARQALREAKQLLETGATMPPDRAVTRRPTLTSIPLEVAIRRAGSGGRL